ncbi:hypothetical protein [Saccharolobus islandicus]
MVVQSIERSISFTPFNISKDIFLALSNSFSVTSIPCFST